MDVALIGADTPLGLELRRLFVQWGRHQSLDVNLAASRFRSERQAKKAARRGNPDAVLDLRLVSQLSAGTEIADADVERCHWLAKACERSGMLYLLVSSDRVYSGRVHRSLRESDTPDAEDDCGRAFLEAESRVRDAAPSSCILRTGPIFVGAGDTLLEGTLTALAENRHVTLDDSEQFCPSGAVDIARVLAAMLDQVSVEADAAGVFHYCSSDRTTRYGFAEVVLASAGQFADLGDVSLTPEDGDSEGLSRTLDCSRLRDAFAIKQLPWRAQINLAVKTYFLEKQ